MTVKIEQKNIIEAIVKKFIGIFNINSFRQNISRLISSEYNKGIEESEIQFNMNFIPSNERVSFLNDYVYNNLEFATDALGNDLRGELSRGILNGEKLDQLKKRVKDVFQDKKFNNRMKMVIRTEKLRANNTGALDGALQSGLPLKKYVDIILDDVTSDICKAENAKYGTPEQAIPLDQEFIVKSKNKTYRAQAPPFHPNCRTTIRFVRQEE